MAAILDAAQTWKGEIPGRDRVRMVVAGAPPPTRLIERMETELGWEFIQIYGLTETAPLLTMSRGPRGMGRARPGGRARRSSAGRARRRWACASTSAIRVRCSPVRTWCSRAIGNNRRRPPTRSRADGSTPATAATIDDDDYLSISDRKKDVIISGGENVSSIEVEDCLYQHAAVAEACVIGVPDEKWGETVKALVVLKPGTDATEADLIAHCRDVLTHFKCPTSIEFRVGVRAHLDGQAAEVQDPRAVLGRPGAPDQLTPATASPVATACRKVRTCCSDLLSTRGRAPTSSCRSRACSSRSGSATTRSGPRRRTAPTR